MRQKLKRKTSGKREKRNNFFFLSSFIGVCVGGVHMRVGHERLRLIKYLPG